MSVSVINNSNCMELETFHPRKGKYKEVSCIIFTSIYHCCGISWRKGWQTGVELSSKGWGDSACVVSISALVNRNSSRLRKSTVEEKKEKTNHKQTNLRTPRWISCRGKGSVPSLAIRFFCNQPIYLLLLPSARENYVRIREHNIFFLLLVSTSIITSSKCI